MCPLQTIAEELLGRSLVAQDGMSSDDIASAERALGRALPTPLKAFYRLLGNLPQFTSAFEEFIAPLQLRHTDGLLMFLDENQEVCSWGVDSQGRVFQCMNNDRFDTGLDLQTFLELILQYQVAQGSGYGYNVGLSDSELADLLAQEGWEKTVSHDQLLIHRLRGFLIWCFLDENGKAQDNQVFFAGLTDPPDAMKQRYGLTEL
ncbi:MAG: hypothetical protein FWC42_09060 [Proteobacteria bacterium]|nr:hypothetical protein [Pseudomonadota bacterium]MCL2310400.1 hypothetical protein [Pseudomonadota bacterium]